MYILPIFIPAWSLYLITLLFFHWAGDFLFQSNKMALNKSTSVGWLTYHTAIYMLTMAITVFFLPFTVEGALMFLWGVGITHWSIDFVTSKLNAYFWVKEKRHAFFTMIGFDQFLHITTIILLFVLLSN